MSTDNINNDKQITPIAPVTTSPIDPTHSPAPTSENAQPIQPTPQVLTQPAAPQTTHQPPAETQPNTTPPHTPPAVPTTQNMTDISTNLTAETPSSPMEIPIQQQTATPPTPPPSSPPPVAVAQDIVHTPETIPEINVPQPEPSIPPQQSAPPVTTVEQQSPILSVPPPEPAPPAPPPQSQTAPQTPQPVPDIPHQPSPPQSVPQTPSVPQPTPQTPIVPQPTPPPPIAAAQDIVHTPETIPEINVPQPEPSIPPQQSAPPVTTVEQQSPILSVPPPEPAPPDPPPQSQTPPQTPQPVPDIPHQPSPPQSVPQTPSVPQPTPQPPSSPTETVLEIPGYEIIGKIGEGTTSVVWKAKQQSLARTVAIKVLKQKYSDSPEDVQSFIDEARSVAKLKSHNIIHIYDVGRVESTYYFVMEFVDGETLGQLLEREDKLSRKRSLTIIRAIAEGLEGAWNSCQIIHRDIKPENIMIDTDGRVKIADLGLASIVKPREGKNAATEAMSGSLAGTPNYMSPEQARSVAHLDSRSDMYSLGALLYHMVTGKLPFENKNPVEVLQDQVSGQLTNPRTLVPSISIGFSQLITRLMMKMPNDRFRNWTEAVADIKKVASGKIIVGSKSSDAISTIAPPGKDPLKNLPMQPDLLSNTVPPSPLTQPKQPTKKSFVIKKRQHRILPTPVTPQPTVGSQEPPSTIPVPHDTADMPDTTHTSTPVSPKRKKETPLETQPAKSAWWITAMIWIFILGWLGLTRWSLIQLPPSKEIPPVTANTTEFANLHTSETAPDLATTPDTRRPVPATLENKANPPSALPTPQSSSFAKVTPDKTADIPNTEHRPSARPTMPVSTPQNIAPLKRQLLDRIISSKPQTANALINRERNAQQYATADIDNLSSLIRHATTPDRAIKSALSNLIGQEINLDISGRTVTVRVKTVIANKITGDRISSSGQSHPITFDINQLGPKEQAQLLENEQSPEMSVLRFALLIKAGDYTTARSVAEQCGSLSETFSEYTADRILTLIQ